jgi:hypothetical protein
MLNLFNKYDKPILLFVDNISQIIVGYPPSDKYLYSPNIDEVIYILTQCDVTKIVIHISINTTHTLCDRLRSHFNIMEYSNINTFPNIDINMSMLTNTPRALLLNKIGQICNNQIDLININFGKCVTGYHLVNTSSINETIWEDINTIIFKSLGIDIYSTSDGSHLSGMDINCSLGKISNKSAKYSNNKNTIDISSYRLTTICSDKRCGNPTEIIEEINKRKNFDYYSFILRDENSDKSHISYDWLLIPSDNIHLDPASYTWEPTIGKRGKNKDSQVGWNTNVINGCKMSITFSMSSQLWIHLEMTEEIRQFIIASTTVENKPKYNYMELLDKLTGI